MRWTGFAARVGDRSAYSWETWGSDCFDDIDVDWDNINMDLQETGWKLGVMEWVSG